MKAVFKERMKSTFCLSSLFDFFLGDMVVKIEIAVQYRFKCLCKHVITLLNLSDLNKSCFAQKSD